MYDLNCVPGTFFTGGAEIYHEYGFVQVAVQRYVRGANSISVELHTMGGDAFGVSSFARSSAPMGDDEV